MSRAIPPCFNCGKKPTVHKQRGRYPFRLDPPPGYGCPGGFHLESHQKTRDACIADWIRYQARFTARTPPMTADDVRARFEASMREMWGDDFRPERDAHSPDEYLHAAEQMAWSAYRAAHADRDAEVRELVEAARVVERRLIPLLSGKLHDIDHADFVAFFAALAKFTQEKP